MALAERLYNVCKDRKKIQKLCNMLERVEEAIHRFRKSLLDIVKDTHNPEIQAAIHAIQIDQRSVERSCVSHVMGRDFEKEIYHDLVNNEDTNRLYEELASLIPIRRSLKALHDRQRAICDCLKKLGFPQGRNTTF